VGARLGRYRDIAWFLAKYARTDVLSAPGDGIEVDDARTVADADAFAEDLKALGPTFIKLGQVLSTRPDLIPARYLPALAKLQDEVEPVGFMAIETIVQAELGTRLSKAFECFDEVPLAAASLGQVHRARIRGGRDVAVKVQRPDVRERVKVDLEALDEIARLVDRFAGSNRNFDARRTLEEFRQTLLVELDYLQEARHLETMSHQLRDFETIVVPLPVADYTTSRVLTMDFIDGCKVTAVSPVEWTEVDGRRLAEDLFRAYLQQILIDGTFHADPHPGNVFLTRDGRLGLIDLGMIGHLAPHQQERLLRLVLAISHGDGEQAAAVAIDMGERREDFDEAALRRLVATTVGRYRDAALKDLNVGKVMLDMTRRSGEHGLKMSPEFALLGKALLNLDEIARTLDPGFDPNASIRRQATRLMQKRMLKSMAPSNVFASVLDIKDFAERLPGRVNRILESLAANDLRLKVEVIDRGSIIDGLQKVANRIALGLVLAALIVGAAMLMRVPTNFTIFGYPGIAMLLFLSAAGGGVWMAWTILAGDVKAHH
jgi:predicted unusual protein kinase regulating ubiquinone biosynthesis (AarF/ABC1/UbiB family)